MDLREHVRGLETWRYTQSISDFTDWDITSDPLQIDGDCKIESSSGSILDVKGDWPLFQNIEHAKRIIFTGEHDTVTIRMTGKDKNLFRPYLQLVAESGATANVVIMYDGDGGAVMPVIEVVVKENATLKHFNMTKHGGDASHFAHTRCEVQKNGVYETFLLGLGKENTTIRQEVACALVGEQARCFMHGAYILGNHAHHDIFTHIDHRVADTFSDEVIKGILADKSHGVFQGKIMVARDAQRIIGNQMNRAILLSNHAQIDSKPELEIFADDVQCSHGATAGELDETGLFYLRSRGIPEQTARKMLIESYLQEILSEISHDETREMFTDKAMNAVDGILG